MFVILSLLLLLVACMAYLIYRGGRANEDFFQSWRIKHSKPQFIFGHAKDVFTAKVDQYQFVQAMYGEFPREKANAVWDMRTPHVVIRDPQLLKQMLVKDFDHFTDHHVIFDEQIDPVMGNTLVVLTGPKWREMRNTLSPAFTGSKMRAMFQLVAQVTDQLVRHLSAQCEGVVEWDVKDFCGKYTNDVIALTAFGVQVDSLANAQNEFYCTGLSVMSPNAWGILKLLALRFAPQLVRALGLPVLGPSQRSFFSAMVLETMRHRDEQQIVRPDMINILMEVRKEGAKWTDDELVAQCLMFFLAGFETSATVMTVAIYELAANRDIQEKLYAELKAAEEALAVDGETLSYERIQQLKYLDMVVCETLRKWPPAALTDRKCTQDYTYRDRASGLEMHFKRGDHVWVPIYGFHRDPQYFAEPDTFKPERWSEENRDQINMDAYMPFGVGPRSCIANRFALMEIKALLYKLLLTFELVPTEKTQLPVLVTNQFGVIKKDVFVGLKKRFTE